MCQVRLTGSNMVAHQRPSLNHSLLCGLSEVGGMVTPVNDWSTIPTSAVAAVAAGALSGATDNPPKTTSTDSTARTNAAESINCCMIPLLAPFPQRAWSRLLVLQLIGQSSSRTGNRGAPGEGVPVHARAASLGRLFTQCHGSDRLISRR